MTKKHIVAVDLHAARRKSGLRQRDLAHLLAVSESRVSHIETGLGQPTPKQLMALSIIYGKPMEALASGFLDEVVDVLVGQLRSIPASIPQTTETFNRAHTLSDLARRLKALTLARHGGK